MKYIHENTCYGNGGENKELVKFVMGLKLNNCDEGLTAHPHLPRGASLVPLMIRWHHFPPWTRLAAPWEKNKFKICIAFDVSAFNEISVSCL